MDKSETLLIRKAELESLVSENRKKIMDGFGSIGFFQMQQLIDSTNDALRMINKIDKDLKSL